MAKTAKVEKTAREAVLDMDWYYEWKHDESADMTGLDGASEVLVCFLKDENGMVRASIGGVADPTSEYARELERDLATEALTERAGYCKPLQQGLASTTRSVSARLSRLLTALDNEITGYVVSGSIVDEVASFRYSLIKRLRAGGWEISYNDARQRWDVRRGR